jgi:hypothetical protein
MQVFLSWSGDRSKRVAEALREWLPSVVQQLEPFMSASDIDKGSQWFAQMSGKLGTSRAGVLCLTRENLAAPWLLFEAGAIAKAVEQQSLACTYLLDIEPTEVGGPLAQFQATRSDSEDTLRLLSTLNARVATPLPQDRLERAFETWWPALEGSLATVRAMPAPQQHMRPQSEKIDEILSVVRELLRSQAARGTQRIRDFRDMLRDLSGDQDFKQALDAIPHDYKMAVLLADVEGFRHKEIAEILDCPIGTVASRLRRGRRMVEESMERIQATKSAESANDDEQDEEY